MKMAGKQGKVYGLIIKKKPGTGPITAKPSIFGDSSSDEEKEGRKNVNNTIQKEAEKKKQMRQTQMEIDKVLEEDPTAYDYDKVYDKMTERKAQLVAAKSSTSDKKPKYISNLLKFAETRKKEEERRVERQVQKEREAEGNEFSGKDAFVTSAYRKKMQELAEDEERQRKLDELEGDVTKQTDLSKFYRNLLDKNVSTGGAYDTEDRSKPVEKHTEMNRRSSSPDRSRLQDIKRGKEKTSNKDGQHEDKEKTDRRGETAKQSRGNDEQYRDKDKQSRSRDEQRRSKDEQRRGKDEQFRDRNKKRRGKDEQRGDKSDRRREKGEQHRKKKDAHEDKYVQQRGDHFEEEEMISKHEKKDKSKRTEISSSQVLNDSQDGEDMQDRDIKNEEKRKEQSRSQVTGEDKMESNKTSGKSTDDDEQKLNQNVKDEKRVQKEQHEANIASKFAKHSSTETILSAKERYLARKKARVVVLATSEDEED